MVIFTDLDGTLLDYRTYSFEEALPALNLLKERKIPLVLCSSKTRAEIEHYRRLLDNHDPFIVENGGAVFIPKGYFPFPISAPGRPSEDEFYIILELGVPYPSLVQALRNIREELDLDLRGFSDMEKEEVVALSGLSLAQAAMALQREWGEPFRADLSPTDRERLEKAVLDRGLRLTVGDRFYHLTGGNDKGQAAKALIGFYRRRNPGMKTVALGDSLNDLPMLQAVDIPILLPKSEGGFDLSAISSIWSISSISSVSSSGIRMILGKEAGPRGWNSTIMSVLGALKD